MPVIALLTDFGLRDHYVAAMKGVMLGICPGASLVDITHEIPAQDVLAGALEIAACYRFFPAGTVFLAVVDPGVGSARRPIAAAAGGYRFVAPDNGLLAPVFEEAPPEGLVQLAEPRFAAASVSRTFEGRDRFAPAAAWLARGVDLGALGPRLDDWERLPMPGVIVRRDEVTGQVVRVDHFGNLVTNITAAHLAHLAGTGPSPCVVQVAGGDVARLVSTYSEVPEGAACALVGSTGHLEISVNKGSAAKLLAASRGTPVTIRRAS